MLHLTSFEDSYGVTRTWKGMDFGLLDELYERGWISNPKTKAKSVVLTEEGERLAREFFNKHFLRQDTKE